MTDTVPVVRSLARKLAEVMKAVERVPKSGHNDFHNYDYATEADIVAAVRQELASRYVILLPAIVSRTREPIGEKGYHLTHLDMEFTFMDGESGEEKTLPWLGVGSDKDDKGAYKAMTGGEKYFLLKTFLIPTGDDPEDESAPEAEATPVVQHVTLTPATAPARPATARPTPGALRVTTAKVAKTGTSKKGPWTLYAVKFSDGREGTTFSAAIYGAAKEAAEVGCEVDADFTKGADGKTLNLTALKPVFQIRETRADELQEAPF